MLLATVLTVAIFAANRRRLVTALGPPIVMTDLGFTICMPKDWQPASPPGKTPPGPGLWFRRPRQPQEAMDKLTQKTPQRLLIFVSMNPNAPDEDILDTLRKIATGMVLNDNTLNRAGAPQPGPAWLDKRNYQHRRGNIAFNLRGTNVWLRLVTYHIIKARQRVFLCIIAGNTSLDAADEAVLSEVISTFELLSSEASAGPN